MKFLDRKLFFFKKEFVLICFIFLFLFLFSFFKNDLFLISLYNLGYMFLQLLFLYFLFSFFLNFKKCKHPKFIHKLWFYCSVIFTFFLFFIQSYFLKDAIYRKDSLALSYSAILFFFTEIFPVSLLLFALCVFLLLLFVANVILKKEMFFLSIKNVSQIMIFLLVLLFLLPLLSPNYFSNPYNNTLKSFSEKIMYERVDLNNFELIRKNESLKFNSFNKNISFDKETYVFLIMESINYDEFYDFVTSSPYENNFYLQYKPFITEYTSYYTLNQDSRTSLMSVFSETFIPYESYLYNWEDVYGKKIFSKDSFFSLAQEQGYETQYFIASQDIPEIGKFYPWNKTHTINYNHYKEKYVCINEIANQRACEDIVILDDLITATLKPGKKVLVVELVFGHGERFFKEKGMLGYEYYNDFFLNYLNALEKNNVLNSTKIIIFSDHGRKGKDTIRTLKGYHIPLLVLDFTQKEYKNDDALLNHLDFMNLIFRNMSSETLSDDFYIIGPTQSDIVVYVKDKEKYSFLNYGRVPYLFKSKGITNNESIVAFTKFKKYQYDYFGY
jgi:hypothetical protein